MLLGQDTLQDAYSAGETSHEVACPGITLASWPALLEISDGAAKSFVWSDEGRLSVIGAFEFNTSHQELTPMIVDQSSAALMKTMHDALNETNKSKFRELVSKSRWHFTKLRKFCERMA